MWKEQSMEILTTVMTFLMLVVIAEFISASVGGSTRSEVFSSSDSNLSVPRRVTQG
jgi:hypothetical protein